MNSSDRIFKERLIESYLDSFDITSIVDYEKKRKILMNWKEACENHNIDRTKETTIQGLFMTQVFGMILNYITMTEGLEEYNQEQEKKSILDTSEADGVLGYFTSSSKDIRVVIELKDAKTPLDKKQNRTNHLTPVEQAFSYANKNGSKCGWVIVSNFKETRLYKSSSSLEYEVFYLMDMDKEYEFKRFYFFLSKNNLINKSEKSLIDTLYIKNEEMGIQISNEFYKTYKSIRNDLFTALKFNNPEVDEILLFTKSQKIMDRFVFVCFCENCGLLPEYTYKELVNTAHKSFDNTAENFKVWNQLKGLFFAIDRGSPPMNINRYNGGLFKIDNDLDNLKIPDNVLERFLELSTYDFNSDLNVNILGQIFEQSISDVEHLKAEISGVSLDGRGGKRKDDGIFYTPYYVTRYIIEKTVGRYLCEQKEKIKNSLVMHTFTTEVVKYSTQKHNKMGVRLKVWIEIPAEKKPSEFSSIKLFDEYDMYRRAIINLHYEYWCRYETILIKIKILDPACGSGAFLNQCLDYLSEEMNYVLDMKRHFADDQVGLFDIDKEILQNNLFGVDLNVESVEITKLSLWLKTAKKTTTLATLDNNIKCGNSIIADKSCDLDNAFIWEDEFPSIMEEGGFDVIIGNPPYGATLNESDKKYISNNYETTEYNYDTYKTFLELGYNLLKPDGYMGYITPNTYFSLIKGANKLREFLFSKCILLDIVELFNVFEDAIVDTSISIYKKQIPDNECGDIICIPRNVKLSSTFLNDGIHLSFTQKDIKEEKNYIFNYRVPSKTKELLRKIKKNPTLDTYFKVTTGAKPYQVGKGTPPQTKEMVKNKVFQGFKKIDDTWKPYFRGESINRYTSCWQGEYIKFGKWLAEPRYIEGEKLFVRQTADRFIATYDIGNVCNNTLHMVSSKEENKSIKLKYVLGILNSHLLEWFFKSEHPMEAGKVYNEVKGTHIKQLPLAFDDIHQDKVVDLVDQLLDLYKRRYVSETEFINYISEVYTPKKLTKKIIKFYIFSYKDFIDELKVQKSKISSKEQMNLLSLYDEVKKEVNDLDYQILNLQQILDNEIYSIYHITSNERKYIEGSLDL